MNIETELLINGTGYFIDDNRVKSMTITAIKIEVDEKQNKISYFGKIGANGDQKSIERKEGFIFNTQQRLINSISLKEK